MTLRIVPYTAEHEEAVRAFNARLAEKNLDHQPVFDGVSDVPRSGLAAQTAGTAICIRNNSWPSTTSRSCAAATS